MTQTAQDTRTLVFERNLPQPPEKVWRALTEAGLIEQWLMKNDFKATKGHKFQFRVETPYSLVVESEVLTATPHQELSYRWDSNGLESIVTWTLTPTAGGTHLRMVRLQGGPLPRSILRRGQVRLGRLPRWPGARRGHRGLNLIAVGRPRGPGSNRTARTACPSGGTFRGTRDPDPGSSRE